jgi:hypothetical protein
MQPFPNIEKSAFRRGEYVGYADGVWRIARNFLGTWTAYKDTQSFTRRTLREISEALDVTANAGRVS